MVQYVPHPAFPQPEDSNIAIWRYLTPIKFEWLVKEKRLFMPNAAHLGDPLEGTQPPGNRNWWNSLAANTSTQDERRTIEHNFELISRFAAAFRTRFYVSCWHMNETLTHEMWRAYAGQPESVAVRATFAKLRAALPAYIGIGMVRYIDYTKERLPTLNMLEYVTHKNRCFAHERELRAVAMHPVVEGLDQQHFRQHHFKSEKNPSFRVYAPPIDVSALLDLVSLHPQAPNAFAETVASLCQECGLPPPERAVF